MTRRARRVVAVAGKAEKEATTPEEPGDLVVATLHLPMGLAETVKVLEGFTSVWPGAVLRTTEDSTRPEVAVPRSDLDAASDRSSRATELLAAIVNDDVLRDLISSARDEGVLTGEEVTRLEEVEAEAKEFLGFASA